MVSRIKSGIRGLDSLIEGGIPLDSYILLVSDPCQCANVLLENFAYQGLVDGEGVVYCNVTRSAERVRNEMKYYGMDIEEFEKKGQIMFVSVYEGEVEGAQVLSITPDDLLAVSVGLKDACKIVNENYPVRRAICESTGDILAPLDIHSAIRFGKAHAEIRQTYRAVSIHSALRGIRDDFILPFTQHSDGCFEITTVRKEDRIETFFRIVKLSFTHHSTGLFKLDLDKRGVRVIEKGVMTGYKRNGDSKKSS